MFLWAFQLLVSALVLSGHGGLPLPSDPTRCRGLPADLLRHRATARPAEDVSTALVVLGGCGDLAKSKIFPGLLRIHQRGELPAAFLAVGCGREARTAENFRELLRERMPPASEDFLSMVDYCQMQSYGSRTCLERLLGGLLSRQFERVIVYFALPPTVFLEALISLIDISFSGLQLVLEKPIGRDAASCRSLLAALGRVKSFRSPLLVDHYLGKEVVRSIPSLRFGNSVIEPSLSRHHVRFVEGKPTYDLHFAPHGI